MFVMYMAVSTYTHISMCIFACNPCRTFDVRFLRRTRSVVLGNKDFLGQV